MQREFKNNPSSHSDDDHTKSDKFHVPECPVSLRNDIYRVYCHSKTRALQSGVITSTKR